MLVQPDRKIVVAGNAMGSAKMTVTRLMPNGSLDTTFDGDGTATIDFGSVADIANGAVLQPDGRIVVAGYSRPRTPPPLSRASTATEPRTSGSAPPGR